MAAHAERHKPKRMHWKRRRILIVASDSMRRQVELAASLRGFTVVEYVKRAINASMRSEGVDAELFAERERRTAK